MPSKRRGVHVAISPRELITGKKMRVPKFKTGQYVFGKTKTTNNVDEPRCVDGLYVGPNDNGTGDWVFKLDTKKVVSVKQTKEVPIPQSIIDSVEKMAEEEGQSEGLEFLDIRGNTTINDLITEMHDGEQMSDDDMSDASDPDYEFDKKQHKEIVDSDEREYQANEPIPEENETQQSHFFKPMSVRQELTELEEEEA